MAFGRTVNPGGVHAERTGQGQQGVALRLKKSVVLIGMMGAGKTAVGSAVARMLAVPFLDSDEEIERAANMSVAEIFRRDGEPFFRARETEVLSRLLNGPVCVLSTGGGAYLNPVNREAIAEAGIAVWLKADLELLWQRVRHKTTRPLLRTADPKASLGALYEARTPIYALAELAVEAKPDYTVEEMAEQVIDALKRRPDIVETAR
ncbi:MAG: shikimate kinase [Paracoccaceae bacterium]